MKADELGVDVQTVLAEIYDIDGQLLGDEIRILCPNPKHDDHDPSCYINAVTGFWQCWSCEAKGDIITLGSIVLNRRRAAVKELLLPSNQQAQLALVQRKLRKLRKPAVSVSTARDVERAWVERPWLPADAREPQSYRAGPLDYLLDRGFTEECLSEHGIRYVRSTKVSTKKGEIEIHNSIAIPIFCDEGRLLAWCYRTTDLSPRWQPRYLYTHNAPLVATWFNLHRFEAGEIVVAEGALDAMWLCQWGIPAVAQLGSKVSPVKADKLTRFRKVTLFFDRDKTGPGAAFRLGQILWYKVPVSVAMYPRGIEGKDPQELDPTALELAVTRAKPWTAWTVKSGLQSA